MSERVAFALNERLGEGFVMPHHGSLARELRFDVERRLRSGELRAVVATASLELGIDIGSVDLVVQLGSPRAIAVALQRIGRSGHWVGALPKGILYATTRDELVECAAHWCARFAPARSTRWRFPKAPLDILAQQIVAACAQHEWEVDASLRDGARRLSLSRAGAPRLRRRRLAMLADGIATSRGRSGTFLHYDRVNGRLRARRGRAVSGDHAAAARSPIPPTISVVVEPEGQIVGTLDEDFAIESMAGDIFLLGTNSWKIRRVGAGVVRVEDAHGAPPSIPFWNGEGRGRTIELSREVCAVRIAIDERDDAAAAGWLKRECALDLAGAEQAVAYVRAGKEDSRRRADGSHASSPSVSSTKAGGMQLILHTPFGARINRAWGLALRKKFCRSFNLELQAAATDNGIVLSLTDQHAFPLDVVFEFVKSASAEQTLTQALLPAPMFAARWRWNATRALAILRFSGGRKVPPQLIRMRADDLIAAVFPDQAACPENLTGPIRIPDHVLGARDDRQLSARSDGSRRFRRVLREVESGALETVAIDTPEPSVFCHEILNANPYAFLDDAPLEERRTRAVTLRRTTRDDVDGAGILDPAAIAEVSAESWPVVRDADELHDALSTLFVLPPVAAWQSWFDELIAARRATTLLLRSGARLWTCAERLVLARCVYEDATLDPEIAAAGEAGAPTREEAFTEVLRGWLESSGPQRVAEVAATAATWRRRRSTRRCCARSAGPSSCADASRRVLPNRNGATAASWRASTGSRSGRLRREIEPVTTAQYVAFLQRWQHVAPASRLHGVDGTLQIVRQLEGYEIPTVAWEAADSSRARRRIQAGVPRSPLLCGRRHVGAPHAASGARAARRRREPARTPDSPRADRALSARANADELIVRGATRSGVLSHAAREVLEQIEALRAPFFAEIVRATKRLPSEVEEALWQLVAAGLVTADGFDALRSLSDAKRRLGEKGLRARPRSSSGRWTLLQATTERIDREAFARRLLARWGVVFRDVIARETSGTPLARTAARAAPHGSARRDSRRTFRCRVRGRTVCAARGGRGVARGSPRRRRSRRYALGAYDPLNLAGIIVPAPRARGPTSAGRRSLFAGVDLDVRRWPRRKLFALEQRAETADHAAVPALRGGRVAGAQLELLAVDFDLRRERVVSPAVMPVAGEAAACLDRGAEPRVARECKLKVEDRRPREQRFEVVPVLSCSSTA